MASEDDFLTVTASDWIKGISLSIAASVIGGASKLAIRKSYLMEQTPVASTTGCDTDDDVSEEESDGNSSLVGLLLVETGLGDVDGQSMGSHDSSARLHESAPPRYLPGSYRQQVAVSPKTSLPRVLRLSGMFGMTFLNPLCCVLAMNYASPSILAPFSGLTLVWIVVLSQPVIGERPNARKVLAAALIVVGEVVVAVFGDHTNNDGATVESVRESYLRIPLWCYLGGMTLWMLALAYCTATRHDMPSLQRFCWGVSGGSITGMQNFLKDALTLTKASGPAQRDAASWLLLAVFLVLAVLTAFGGLLLLTACMKRYDATYSASMFVGSFVVSASIMSTIHYDTFGHLDSTADIVMYLCGLSILVGGVFMLNGDDSSYPLEEDDKSTAEKRSDAISALASRRVWCDSLVCPSHEASFSSSLSVPTEKEGPV